MAHPNCSERQQAVTAIHNEGIPFTKEVRRGLALLFNCSASAITRDVWQIQLKGTLDGPSPLADTVFVSNRIRKEVLKRDAGVCQYCGCSDARMIVEHVIPYKLGGFGRPYNLVAACELCNMRKGTNVWVPRNLDVITADAPEWRNRILTLAVTPHHGGH